MVFISANIYLVYTNIHCSLKSCVMKEKLKSLGSLNLGRELTRNQQKKITGGNFRCANSPMSCVQDISDEAGYCAAVWHSYPVSCSGGCPSC